MKAEKLEKRLQELKEEEYYCGLSVSQKKELEEIKERLKNIKENNVEIMEGVEEYVEGWGVPMPSEKSVISDKKMDYKTLGLITLVSNRKTEYIEGIDFTEEEQHRYIYDKGDNSIKTNETTLENMSKWKIDTIKRNLKKLAKCNNEVVSYCEDSNGKYYKIMPYTLGDNGTLQYVTIDSRILEYLINTFDSNAIKIYCVLLWVLWDNENKCYIEKQLTYDWLLKQIGLSGTNGGKNSKMLKDILFTFEKVGLIKIDRKVVTFEQQGYNSIVKKVYYYSMGNVEEFIKARNSYHKQ